MIILVVPYNLSGRTPGPTVEQLGPFQTLGSSEARDRKFRQTRTSSIRLLERPARVWTMPAEIKCLLCRRETALTCRDSVGYPRSREEVHHSRHMHQCYSGEQCTHEGQKTPPGNSGRSHVPRGHNAVPSWERLHLFHRAVSNHDTAVHCSVGSFRGNCSPREPSLKSNRQSIIPHNPCGYGSRDTLAVAGIGYPGSFRGIS